MRAQHARSDVLPLTWEIPGLIAFGWLVLAVVGLPAGQALVFAVSGGGFAWPDDVLAAVGGLMRGRPGVGVADATPAVVFVYGAICLVELAVGGFGLWALSWWWRSCGPGAQYGFASRHEVTMVLGERELHRRRAIIRPDLFGRR
jgi:hypothetical protein